MSDHGMPPGFGPKDPTAPDQAQNEHARVGFKICEHAPRPGETESHPWVQVEIDPPGLSALNRGNAYLGLQCRSGISFEEAKRFAHEMERIFDGISLTKFIT